MARAPKKTSLRWTYLKLSGLLVFMAGMVGMLGQAADHRDGPIFVNTQANGRRDINDVYVFKSPATPTNTVLAMTFCPFAGAVTPVTFDDSDSFLVETDSAEVAMTAASLTALMNSYVLAYEGAPIDRPGLLRYLVSYREHAGFHEHCVERIFVDLLSRCGCDLLTVYARFTRRGGIDINPFRTTAAIAAPPNVRTARQ